MFPLFGAATWKAEIPENRLHLGGFLVGIV
jgi:hypothetical protein